MFDVIAAALLAATPPGSVPMPTQYCQPEPGGPPKAMGVVTGYGLVLAERYRNGHMSQSELMTAIQRIQAVSRELAASRPAAACALIAPIEADYALDRPDMEALPFAPSVP